MWAVGAEWANTVAFEFGRGVTVGAWGVQGNGNNEVVVVPVGRRCSPVVIVVVVVPPRVVGGERVWRSGEDKR